MSERKVFCIDCKGYSMWDYTRYGHICRINSWYDLQGTGKKIRRECYCINKGFDCENYKRKWWKFWRSQ